ncbi:MAG TPA: acetyl-CoA C-acyltransferase, partial [Alphaproteobacteria bacterium]|nr:acetyl-CoA C-acyltransferase [Alphaproteobacteria bacterium]
MPRAAIVAPVRTPVGKFLGALKDIPAERLAAQVVAETVRRSGIDPALVEDVVMAQSYANSEAPCIGRWAALAANLPIEVPGIQIDRRCAGGLQALVTAAMMVETGAADVVIAGGVESMSNIEYYTTAMRGGARAGNALLFDRLERGRERSQPVERFGVISGMIETAENVAKEMNIAREDADAFAAESHRRAAAAQSANRFADEIVAVAVPQKKGDPLVFDADEFINRKTNAEALAGLRPAFDKAGSVTAGNASGIN